MSIRLATKQDVPRILEIYAPYIENTAISFEYTVPSLEEFTQRFLDITAQFPWLVWEENGTILGYAYGSRPFKRTAYQWSAEASIYLCPEARGQGIGRKLYAALEQLLSQRFGGDTGKLPRFLRKEKDFTEESYFQTRGWDQAGIPTAYTIASLQING